ncbi:flavin reductase family protein [Roseinatronobacter alkalisoli]|uniref:Flavin reductase family protein n=1 Tax=Roseinatronobacter alkalisoli TaxID=3028235 RepID=A0ABT5T9F8_9RHOB|nr:flavin reductase family protein [Roseinatronobacter sp. HJB301]MDD7971599.1 flavin reductase family protein [Roseinatronobacter sp. HJB301]
MQDQGFIPDAANLRAFRDALGRFATGITLVTISTDNGPMGFIANSFSGLSLDPPLVLWSPARRSNRFAHFAKAPYFAIHVLQHDSLDWITRFSRDGAGFDGLNHDVTPEGSPVLNDALARFDCAQHQTHDGGDHLIIIGRVLRCHSRTGAPLVFSQGAYGSFIHHS